MTSWFRKLGWLLRRRSKEKELTEEPRGIRAASIRPCDSNPEGIGGVKNGSMGCFRIPDSFF
jgi:hypothetical protein